MHSGTRTFMWLALLWHWLYCGDLEPNLRYLPGVPLIAFKTEPAAWWRLRADWLLSTRPATGRRCKVGAVSPGPWSGSEMQSWSDVPDRWCSPSAGPIFESRFVKIPEFLSLKLKISWKKGTAESGWWKLFERERLEASLWAWAFDLFRELLT